MNRIILLGRMTKEPEIKYTQTGKCVTIFTLAVDRPFKSQDGSKETDFISCQIWGKSAENLGNSVHKGQRLLIEGRLQIRSYDAKDGSKRYVAEVIADRFEYIERKADNNANTSTSNVGGMESFGTSVPFNDEIPF